MIFVKAYWRNRFVAEFFYFVSMTGFWFTLAMLIFYLVHLIEKFHVIPWMLIEGGFCGLWTILLLISSILAATHVEYSAAFGMAAFFGFIAMIAYGYDAFIKYRGCRAGQLAQGERTVQRSNAAEVTVPNSY